MPSIVFPDVKLEQIFINNLFNVFQMYFGTLIRWLRLPWNQGYGDWEETHLFASQEISTDSVLSIPFYETEINTDERRDTQDDEESGVFDPVEYHITHLKFIIYF